MIHKYFSSKSIVQGIHPRRHLLETEVVKCSFMEKAKEKQKRLWTDGGNCKDGWSNVWRCSWEGECADDDEAGGKGQIMKALTFLSHKICWKPWHNFPVTKSSWK